MQKNIAKKLCEAKNKRKIEKLVLATIIAKSGSSPREVGTSMLIFPDGGIIGTIGGGTVENRIINLALEILSKQVEKFEKNLEFDLINKDSDINSICGGNITIFIEKIKLC